MARRLEGDLKARGFRPGDRYRTASEAGLLLGVSSASAHRAMQILVRKQMLVRKPGAGTFVGPAFEVRSSLRVQTVFVFIPEAVKDVTSVRFDILLSAISRRRPGVSVQFGFVPERSGPAYVRELIADAQKSGHYGGAIPISCSRDVNRCLHEAGGPMVVFGSLDPDQQATFPSLDLDYHQAGYVLAKHLCDAGHRRMALFSTGGSRPGDDAFLDGVSEAITDAGLPHNALTIRAYQHDVDAFKAKVADVVSAPDGSPPTGIICCGERLLDIVQSVLSEVGVTPGKDLALVFHGHTTPTAEQSPYVHVQSALTFDAIASKLADMLGTLGDGRRVEENRVVVPVELRVPR